MTRQSGVFAFAGLVLFTLSDSSGQDARLYGRRADHESLATGRTEEALKLYERAYRAAVAASDSVFEYRFLNNIGACQLALFRYNDAEQTLVQVRRLAEVAHDAQTLASADGNLAAVYIQLDDLSAAEIYARESLRIYSQMADSQMADSRTAKRGVWIRATLNLADILSREKLNNEGERLFRAAIEAAESSQDWATASIGWLHYGKTLLERGRLDDTDRAFSNSYRLLQKSGRKNTEYMVLWNLSRLRLRQRNYKMALSLINSAIELAPSSGGRTSRWRLYQTRAEVELATADAPAARRDARTALMEARAWRASIAPDNDNRVGIDGVQNELFSILIDAGNRIYLQTGDPKLLRETFEAAEENRAESLEALLPESSNWRASLSTPEYRNKLSQLLLQQSVVLSVNSREAHERLSRIHTELSQMEADTGAKVLRQTGSVLDHVRKNLPPGSALLSFRLDDRSSWLWSVDHGRLQLYQLPPKAVLLAEIRDFQTAIRDNDIHRIGTVGRRLYRDLLGGPQRSFERSSQWFISLDEPLYTLEFPSLVVENGRKRPVYLTERKTIQVLPGAQLLALPDSGGFTNNRFVLAGDGIYNRADPRFGTTGYGKSALVRPASWSMARLPGSGDEVRFAAELWRHSSLLTGASMTKERLFQEIDRQPDVIHIASHVIDGEDRWHTGVLALGMGEEGEPELLTSREIQLHPVHARLVVMTGCSSGSGEVLPASGLMGLTRAWLAAGVGEVLATRWPTMDESADGLIGSFYLRLLASRDGNIPQALRESRQQMIEHGGWRAEPRYWSGFFLIGVR